MNLRRELTLTDCRPLPGVNGQFVAVVSTFSATLSPNLTDSINLPQFPGTPIERLRGKSFRILTNDVHLLVGGKIARTWHAEDWTDALDQMINGKPPRNLEMPSVQPGANLQRVPEAVENFYDLIGSDLGKSHNHLQTHHWLKWTSRRLTVALEVMPSM